MPNWFLGKIRYQQPIDDSNVGTRNQEFTKQQTITEAYLVDAVSYTEAEARLYQEIAANTPDFEITNISRMLLADVFFNEEDGGDTWYKVKANYLLEDDKTGKQKKVPVAMLINAQNPKQAYERIEYVLKTSLTPFEITDVNTTQILDVFPFEGDEQRTLTPLDDVDTDPVMDRVASTGRTNGKARARSIFRGMVTSEGITVTVESSEARRSRVASEKNR